ncbi:uncharacterized protein LOC121368420 [Gigantopelta aegis]|uniref:uncharacterized protein LOC121368420 n=1 Tax=Gigantopelta aegis TaxID=1735272 RepID=UPI001B88DA4C|nr:uncharacterized protein LOC121368420 [Gigantopelta aegis]XP_041349081.1 uncharacterized protein LOC121368420 [Gigantopelta aegis]XP_041349082.1 uncharacterized protein LOC121368420 [Gigantopelta aegis]XP_041349083.1 uncharacterized protein LOC121368420 [Gigantopelta aegis]
MTPKGYGGTGYAADDGSTETSDDYSVETTSVASSSDNSDPDLPQSSLCCLQGCLATSAVGFSFFIALPTGILMIIYAKNNEDTSLIAVGSVLACLPLITFLILVVVCLNRNRMKRFSLRKNKICAKTRTEECDSPTQKY